MTTAKRLRCANALKLMSIVSFARCTPINEFKTRLTATTRSTGDNTGRLKK